MLPPPVRLVLAYRLLGWRLGPAYREWVLDDLTRRGWLVRQGAPVLVAVLGVGLLVDVAVGADPRRLTALVAVLAGAGAFLRSSLQAAALRKQGLRPDGTALAGWYADDRARVHRNLLGTVSSVVLVLGALVLLALRAR